MAEEFPGNANFQKTAPVEQKNKIQKVVTAPPKQVHKRPTLMEALIDTKGKSIMDYFLEDLLYPTLRRGTSTILHGLVTKLFGGGDSRSGLYESRYVMSNSWADSPARDYWSISSSKPKSRDSKPNLMRLDAFEFASREECENVLAVLDELIDRYRWAPVSAFYEAIGVTADQTYYNYGWDSLAAAKIKQTTGGYVISFPKPRPN